jgi:glucose-6-phosphate isomerase
MKSSRISSWSKLSALAKQLRPRRIESLFDDDADRAGEFSIDAAGLYLDYSKNLIDSEALRLLVELAHECALAERIERLFRGDRINVTEGRAVLHTALRDPQDDVQVDGQPVAAEIRAVQARMRSLVEAVSSGRWTGFRGDRITDVVNIGIGGSHLGPLLACDALRYDAAGGLRVHFCSNVDGGDIDRTLTGLDPATTLFIVASKSFTTPETALNANSARRWLLAAAGDEAATAKHFLAISAHPAKAAAFGIPPDNVLPMWDWVGGRYSLWSAIGLPIAFALGMDGFERLLAGAAAMDRHFRSAPFERNMPVLFALVGIWNTNFLGAESFAVVPYDDRLFQLPSYLQQLEMESNGKRVTLANRPVKVATAPILWGGLGTNVQHAFFQLLHQGTRLIPVDFILAMTHQRSPREHHDMLVANCIAQAEALMCGRQRAELDDGTPAEAGIDLPLHRETPGNQPSNMLIFESLTPETLGALLALYEHKTYVQGVIWGINSFDQWGVELGKKLAGKLLAEIGGGTREKHDGSTRALLERYLRSRR